MAKQKRILQLLRACRPHAHSTAVTSGGERTMATLVPPVPERDYTGEDAARFSEALHRYWGYESFRPGQHDIVRSIATGRDACVVMPTGGGKSLCYQLPAALAAPRTVVVVC